MTRRETGQGDAIAWLDENSAALVFIIPMPETSLAYVFLALVPLQSSVAGSRHFAGARSRPRCNKRPSRSGPVDDTVRLHVDEHAPSPRAFRRRQAAIIPLRQRSQAP